MLGTPSSAPVAGAQAIVVAGLLFFFGFLLVGAVTRGRIRTPAAVALALPALLMWTLLLMVCHLVSGGRVLSEPWLVRGLTLVALLVSAGAKVWIHRKKSEEKAADRPYALLMGAALAAAAAASLWPLLRLMPVPTTPDAQLHAGWAMQLLAGNSTPSATVTGDIPNYYPWMFHAFAAFIARFVPGGHVWHALGVIQVLQVAGVVAGLFAAGRELAGRLTGGLAAAAFGAFAGGVGFVFLRGVEVAPRGRVDEGVMRYGGDLLEARPYNTTFFNLPPPLPRDVAFALITALFFALIAGYGRKSVGWVLVAGAVAGLVGLTGGETWIVALISGVVVCLSGTGLPRRRAVGAFLGPALGIYAIWFVPTLINYVSLGGFVDTTHQGPVILPPLGFLGAWGVMVPFALWGLRRTASRLRSEARLRVAGALVAGAVIALLVSSLIPLVLGEAFSTLETKHRYWPFVHVTLALIGAIGFGDVVARVAKRNISTAAALCAIVVAIGLVSPVVASMSSTRKVLDDPGHRLTHASLVPGAKTVQAVLLDRDKRDCVVAVPPKMSQTVFAFTGFRQVLWQGGAKGPNRARIRWRDIYDRIPGDRERLEANATLTSGSDPASWRAAVKKYGVDLVVVGTAAGRAEAFKGYPSERARYGPGDGFLVFEVGNC